MPIANAFSVGTTHSPPRLPDRTLSTSSGYSPPRGTGSSSVANNSPG